MPNLSIGGINLHVQQAGAGPDVILIHGVTGDLSIWFLCNAMSLLAETHRVTAFDLRGHGYSDVPPDGYTSHSLAGDVLGLMDAIGAPRARVVGHSFGGVVAAHTAVLAPDRVDALVLSDPYFPAIRHLEEISRWGHWREFCDEASEAGVTLSDEFWYDLDKFFDQVLHLDGDGMLKFRRAVGLPTMNRLLRLGKTTCGPDSKAVAGLTTELLEKIQCPTLAIYGDASPFLATATYLENHLPNCRSELVPNARHRAPEENPTAFVTALKSFLDSVHPVAETVR